MSIAIVGAGPAGLFAAERLSAQGHAVTLFDRMPTPGRKFLLAGRGGLNLTHAENLETFVTRYGEAAPWLAPMIRDFPPDALRAWAATLGQPCFTGTSGRVFPASFKAAPLLRAWLRRLARQGVTFRSHHSLAAIHPATRPNEPITLHFETPAEVTSPGQDDAAPNPRTLQPSPPHRVAIQASAVLLALGGASWPRMGANGAWLPLLRAHGIAVTNLAPANCGLRIAWSLHLKDRFAGTPLKRVRLTLGATTTQGDAVITRTGLEGGAVYPLAAVFRATPQSGAGQGATLFADLRPDLDETTLARRLGTGNSLSLANRLRRAGLSLAAAALLREIQPRAPQTPLAALIKRLPLPVDGLEPLDRAVSTAGGIARDALTEGLMLRALPGVFAAGEMLDWEAPTGGYLLQACFATAARAAKGIAGFCEK